MQNRKLQGEDIEKLKNEAKIASSEAKITSDGSELGPGGYSRRPLVPSSSETVSTMFCRTLRIVVIASSLTLGFMPPLRCGIVVGSLSRI